jgi:hypothetical protein
MAAGSTQTQSPGISRGEVARTRWLTAERGRQLGRSALVFLLATLLLLAANAAALALHPGGYRVAIGNYRDGFFLRGANVQEVAPDGRSYRWTTSRSELVLGPVGAGVPALLTLELGGRPEAGAAHLRLDGRPWAAFAAPTQPRHLRLLIPGGSAERALTIESQPMTLPGDNRALGVKIEGFRVDVPRAAVPLPAPGQLLAQLVILLAAHLAAARLGLGWRGQALTLALLALGLAALLAALLLLAYAYLPALAVAAVVLAALTWLGLPFAERLAWLGSRHEVRILWAIMLLACAIRLAGVLYPTFDGQDLGRNVRRQLMAAAGQMYIIAGSSEFGDGQTIYPTGPYLFLMPGLLLTQRIGALMELGLALLDGTTALLVAMLVRRFGGGRDAARFGALLFLGNIASYAALVYGFAAQIFGQWFTAPIALVLLTAGPRPGFRRWALAILLLMFGVFSHIGVAILGITWVGFMLLLALRRPYPDLWKAIALFAAACLGAAWFMYLDIAAQTLSHTGAVVGREAGGALLPGATPLLARGFRLAYSDLGVALLPFGLLLLSRSLSRRERLPVVLAMVLAVVLYFLVDITLKLQVRYFYFALPLVLAIVALPLGRLADHGRVGRAAAWAAALIISLSGTALWLSTAFADGSISMTPLTH